MKSVQDESIYKFSSIGPLHAVTNNIVIKLITRFVYVVLRIKSGALYMLGKDPTTELYLQPVGFETGSHCVAQAALELGM
jgi:hypothetical protein